MTHEIISADFPYQSQYIEIEGSKIHYIEQGAGDPILFLHGVPASSYVWRNVVPHLSKLGRCIAPDLIGMGKSAKPDITYSIQDHIRYIEKFIEALQLKNITFILHGWGSIVGFDIAMRKEDDCRSLVFYEAYLRPLNHETLSLPYEEQIFLLKEQEKNQPNMENISQLVDKILGNTSLRLLTEKEKAFYCDPFTDKKSAKPILQYLKELSGKEDHVNQIIANYSDRLKKSALPKLLLYAMPGFITSISMIMWAKDNLPHLEIIDIGEALHYAQEMNPSLMGEAISVWLQGIEQEKLY